jgi:hydroxyacylglutathione hydrolase
MVFKYDLAEGIAQLSYLIGDDSAGVAAVIDPRPDCDIYLTWARNFGVAITHIIETHNHADFMSGARELSKRCGAPIHLAPEPDQDYGFEFQNIDDATVFSFGSTTLTARKTPGHTLAHIALEGAEQGKEENPWGVFTGDSLFVNSAGRPDLSDQAERLTGLLYDTLYEYFLGLDDAVIIYPCHGKGSACGANIGDRLQSTIGYERRNNPFLQFDTREEFSVFVKSGSPPEPTHYARLKRTNAHGPPVLGGQPAIPGLPPNAFLQAAESAKFQVVDSRSILAFSGGYVPGAINIADQAELSVYAGWMLDPEKPILLIVEDDTRLDRVLDLFRRTGFVQFAGYLAGGMTAWANAGMSLETLPQISIHELRANGRDTQILDVRSPQEWKEGHIPGASHYFIGDMRTGMPDLDKKKPVTTYCGSGYRASIAASILQANGFEAVQNVPGSWNAWQSAGYPVEKDRN